MKMQSCAVSCAGSCAVSCAVSCALSCVVVWWAGPALASEPAKVLIEGARYDQRRDDTASTIVVRRDELLQHGDRSLAEALARLPGITVRAGQAGVSAIRLRGLGNGYTQVLLNGVAAPAGFALESLSPELVEKIEIVRTASAQLGVQAIAGTVNIILRKSALRARTSGKLNVDVERGYLSPGASADLAGRGDRFSYTLAGTLMRTRRLSTRVDHETAGEVGLPATRETQRRELNIVDAASVAPRLNWTLNDGAKVSAHALLSINRRTAEGENRETLALAPSAIPNSIFTLAPRASFVQWGLDWERALASGAKVQLEAGGDASHRRSEFAFAGVPRMGSPLHLVSVRLREGGAHSAGKYRAAPVGGHQMVIGWDAARSTRDQTRDGKDSAGSDSAGNYHPADNRRDRYRGVIERAAVFVQDDWQVDAAWSISLGLRAESLDTTAGEARDAPARLRTRFLSPLVQVLYKHGSSAQLRAGLTRTYKAPSMFALIPRRYVVDNNNNETNPDTQGNPGLRPEMAWGLDLGLDTYFGKDTMLGAGVYVRRIEDLTVSRLDQDTQGWVVRQVNGGTALARGMLFEGRLPLALPWALPWEGAPAASARFSLARNFARVEGKSTPLDGQEPVSATVGLDYKSGAVAIGASFSYKAGAVMRWSDRVSSGSGPVRALDITGTLDLGAGKRLRFGAVNLMQRTQASTMQADGRVTTVLERKNIGFRLALEVLSGR